MNSTARHIVAGGGLPTGTEPDSTVSPTTAGARMGGAGATVTGGGGYATGCPPCADAAGPTNDPGLRYNPQARPQISWGPGFWDSQGSYAKIAAGPKPDSTLPETALAIAFVTDPQYYSVTFDPAFQPEVDFSLTIQAGATLVATSTAAGDNRLVSNVPESMDEELSPETFSAIRGELTPPIRTRASSNSQATLHWVWMTR